MRLRWPWRTRLAPPTPEDKERLAEAQRRVNGAQAQMARHGRESRELGRYFRDQAQENHVVERLRDALGG